MSENDTNPEVNISQNERPSVRKRINKAFQSLSKESQLLLVYAAIGVVLVLFVLNTVKLFKLFA